jgi:hypothetical protein
VEENVRVVHDIKSIGFAENVQKYCHGLVVDGSLDNISRSDQQDLLGDSYCS